MTACQKHAVKLAALVQHTADERVALLERRIAAAAARAEKLRVEVSPHPGVGEGVYALI
jgi:hypothetical protein